MLSEAGVQITSLKGSSVAEVMAGFVREKHVAQVVFGRSVAGGWTRYLYLTAINKFLRDAPSVDVHIVTQKLPDSSMKENRCILVVDDEPQITRLLGTSLSSQGYDIRAANDGETALEIMKGWTPDPPSKNG
jgi:K+-sensing histidine kinase KdpD